MTSGLLKLLANLHRKGVTLGVDNGRLIATPDSALSSISDHKQDILLLLTSDPHDARVILDPPDFAQGAVQMREFVVADLAGIRLLLTPAELIEHVLTDPPAEQSTSTTPPPRLRPGLTQAGLFRANQQGARR